MRENMSSVLSKIIDELRDREGPEPWKIRRHPAVRDAFDKFRLANPTFRFMYNMATAANDEAWNKIFREQQHHQELPFRRMPSAYDGG